MPIDVIRKDAVRWRGTSRGWCDRGRGRRRDASRGDGHGIQTLRRGYRGRAVRWRGDSDAAGAKRSSRVGN